MFTWFLGFLPNLFKTQRKGETRNLLQSQTFIQPCKIKLYALLNVMFY